MSKNNSEVETDNEFVYYKDSSGSEPEIECTKWDADGKVVGVACEANSVVGYDSNSIKGNEEPPTKQIKFDFNVNSNYANEAFIEKFKSHWENRNAFSFNGSELIVDPFKVCVLKDFLEEKSLVDKMREEFNDIEWHKRSMDLYEFFQSSDLKHLGDHKIISLFYNFLEQTVMKWISKITGLELVKVSATCSTYTNTDYLLIHDDQQEDRMVAFILYLTDVDWKEIDGGGLQLFNKSEDGQPLQAVKEIFPANNQFVFFQVTNDSYHQVAEVTCKNHCRLSINGWFHSETRPVFQTPLYQPPDSGIFSNTGIPFQEMDVDISVWISEEYLDDETAEQIQSHIEENSEISLCNFFKNIVIQTVLEDLKSESVKWSTMGPLNRYSYSKLEEQDLPQTLERFLLLFKSKDMFDLLKKYTDLDLQSMKYEMQKWTPGSYMLLSDYDWSAKNELDLVLYLGCPDPKSVVGGRTMYVTTEDEVQQALVTVEPQENSLNIIFRDTARFIKYVSKQSSCKTFYILICSYSE